MDVQTPLERVNFFAGQILSADDFRAGQDYMLARLRRHNRLYHGWGVVIGLDVSIEEPDGIVIDAGLAIDCAGNEILVPRTQRLTIPQSIRSGFVTLEYAETPTALVPRPNPDDDSGNGEAFTRIREGCRLGVTGDNLWQGHKRMSTGTPGCGMSHPICIARFRTRRRGGWKVVPRGRRYV